VLLATEDPYDSESVAMAGEGNGDEGAAGLFPRPAQVIESMELGDEESALRLDPPGRLRIVPE
jgi:hypothetical protein